MVVDGYNVIGAWPMLQKKARHSLEDARETLCDMLMNHCGYTGQLLVLVFDAKGSDDAVNIRNIVSGEKHQIVFTSKKQTADQFIERFVREHAKERITVASSDQLIQVMVFSHAARMSARELMEMLTSHRAAERDKMAHQQKAKGSLDERIGSDVAAILEEWRIGKKEKKKSNQSIITSPKKDDVHEERKRPSSSRRRRNRVARNQSKSHHNRPKQP